VTRASKDPAGDLGVTALYTGHAWKWGDFAGAELFATRQGKSVFDATNLVMGAARLVRRDLPSLRHGLVQRHAIIDRILDEARAAGCGQVLELAAGLSPRGAAATADPALRYVEVDLPAMIAHKRALLDRSERGRAIAARPNLVLVGEDVAALDPGAHLVPGPVLVIAEGLAMYLDAAAQTTLWTRLAAAIRDRPGSALVFDLVPPGEQPRPGAVGRALGAAFRRATRGRTFVVDGRTRADVIAQLTGCGFTGVEVIEPRTAPAAWQLPFLDVHTQIVVFRAT
jgi:O-methyltransferase involved in polyketide biosynthesis